MSHIKDFISRVNRRKVAISIIGDTMLDEFYSVRVNRVSPEFPIPILHLGQHTPFCTMPGGAANIVTQMQNFNVRPQYFGLIDERCKGVIDQEFSVWMLPNGHVPLKRRYFSGDFPLCRIDVEEPDYGVPEHIEAHRLGLLSKFSFSSEDVVVLSDYGKGTFSDEFAKNFIDMAHAKEKFPITIVDPKHGPLCKWKGCSIFKPNAQEAVDLTGEKDVQKQIEVIMREVECQAVLITQGSEGVIGNVMGRPFEYKPHRSVKGHPLGYSGAGDCFVAFLAMAMAHTMDVVHAAEIAVEAAAVYVQNPGNYGITEHELVGRLDEVEAKLRMPPKERNYRLVFTNGCFDIIHSGHLATLRRAKAFGDKLVVAVNSDQSVKRLKGETRPIVDCEERMRMLAGLECVDFVVTFDEDTPYNIIQEIKPDVLIKGADWAGNIVGSDIVSEVHALPLIEGLSTSKIIDKIKKEPVSPWEHAQNEYERNTQMIPVNIDIQGILALPGIADQIRGTESEADLLNMPSMIPMTSLPSCIHISTCPSIEVPSSEDAICEPYIFQDKRTEFPGFGIS
jgi:D-beta-D-heptose 7-phosphate kinase/D-beta-D-heptose 1-phosphate adenosyltransferase